jgi:serine/threonine-protein kinase ULK4
MHNSDSAVKPIIGNKEIEKQVDAVYDAKYLSFTPWTSEQIISKIETPQIEAHLNDLYTAIAHNNTINEKVNALLYFESIIVNSNVSNRLINSAFMNLLVTMMK